ncbi:GGDEF domain-containing protein [Leucobacter sp. UCD-THU]|uniref:GGDEF domain-containing protein n=1 Tax=Leucobacter sp. UCD-THU TaxID=1292023 RepID=UPI0003A22C3B
MGRLAALIRRQDAHSLYLASAAFLLGLTLLVDVVFHKDMINPPLTWALLMFCVVGGCVVIAFGRQVPRWIGILSVLIFIVAETYYLSLPDDPQSVISSVQQLPVVAFYLGWFVRPRLAVALIVVCLLVFGATMWTNPLLWADGIIGAPVGVHALLALLFCFGAGMYLWRRQAHAATIDPLTGAYHRQALVDRVAQRLQRRSTRRDPFCLVLIDFDDFKHLNDSRGHAAGDAALFDTTAVWRDELRTGDVIGRIGGDEFALLLPHVKVEGARAIVERLKRASPYPWSAGISQSGIGDTPDSMLARADRGLYREKLARPGRRVRSDG